MNDDKVIAYLKQPDNVSEILPESYKIESLVDSSGGQGVVYRGEVDGIDSAIKLYYPGHNEIRYQREIDAMQKIQSDYLVKLIDHTEVKIEGSSSPLPVTATEFIDGETLSSRIEGKGFFQEESSGMCCDVSRAIMALWEYEIVHRDLKPSNIMLRASNNKACVIDLGFARHIGQTTITTMQGASFGTRGYLSPEQYRGAHDLTCKSDIFALAVILAESVMGQHPTNGNQDRLQEMSWIVNLPQKFRKWEHYELFERMLSIEPSRRPFPTTIIRAIGG